MQVNPKLKEKTKKSRMNWNQKVGPGVIPNNYQHFSLGLVRPTMSRNTIKSKIKKKKTSQKNRNQKFVPGATWNNYPIPGPWCRG